MNTQASVGDRVAYANVNLYDQRGTVRAIGTQRNGGDCLILWDRHQAIGPVVECFSNLRTIA